jgi:hypothetical protein
MVSIFLFFNGILIFLVLLNKNFFLFSWFENFQNIYFENLFHLILNIQLFLQNDCILSIKNNDICYSLFSQSQEFYLNFFIMIFFLGFIVKIINLFFNNFVKVIILNIFYLLIMMDIFDLIILYFDFLIFWFILHIGLLLNWFFFKFFEFFKKNYDRKASESNKMFFWEAFRDKDSNFKGLDKAKGELYRDLISDQKSDFISFKILAAYEELSKLFISQKHCTIETSGYKEKIISLLVKEFEVLNFNVEEFNYLKDKQLNWPFYNFYNYDKTLSENRRVCISPAFIFCEELNFEAFNFLKKESNNIIIVTFDFMKFYLFILEYNFFPDVIKIKKIYRIK